jgi:hypothetical protein
VGNGQVEWAKSFASDFGIHFELYTDPTRESFRRAGLKRTLGFRPKTISAAARAMRAGHWQGRTRGDPLQQGGVVVVSRDGQVLFQHVDSGPGEQVTPENVLARLRE